MNTEKTLQLLSETEEFTDCIKHMDQMLSGTYEVNDIIGYFWEDIKDDIARMVKPYIVREREEAVEELQRTLNAIKEAE